MLKRMIDWSKIGSVKQVATGDECPQGGSHNFEPDWKWDRRIDDYDFTDLICTKCHCLDGDLS